MISKQLEPDTLRQKGDDLQELAVDVQLGQYASLNSLGFAAVNGVREALLPPPFLFFAGFAHF